MDKRKNNGGARPGSGRKAGVINPKRKISYSTKLRPDQVAWLKNWHNQAKTLERLIDMGMKEDCSIHFKS